MNYDYGFSPRPLIAPQNELALILTPTASGEDAGDLRAIGTCTSFPKNLADQEEPNPA